MNPGPDLDLLELHRQLTDLADSAGPWDDPMPEVRRRAVMTPTPTRVPRRWLPASISPLTLGSAAAAVLVVVGAGWLLHGGGSADKKSAATDSVGSAAAAAGGHTSAGNAIPGKRSSLAAPAPESRTAAAPSATSVTPEQSRSPFPCVVGRVSSALVLTAPSEVGAGARVKVSVRAGGSVQGAPPIILVRSGARVVGRLVPATVVAGTHPTSPRPVDEAVTAIDGTLHRVSPVCAQSARSVPSITPDALGPLPAGRYQLIAVSYRHGSFVLSAPVNLVVSR